MWITCIGLIARGVPSGATFGATSTAAAGSGDHSTPFQYDSGAEVAPRDAGDGDAARARVVAEDPEAELAVAVAVEVGERVIRRHRPAVQLWTGVGGRFERDHLEGPGVDGRQPRGHRLGVREVAGPRSTISATNTAIVPSGVTVPPSGQNQWWNGSVAPAPIHGAGSAAVPPRTRCEAPAFLDDGDVVHEAIGPSRAGQEGVLQVQSVRPSGSGIARW